VILLRWLFLCLLLPLTATAQYAPDVPTIPSRGSSHDSGPPRDSAPPIRVDVRLVNVFVNVTDTNGAPVPKLAQSDFSLFEDGYPQKISVFERQSAMPLSIVLAIDTSGSVRKDLPLEQRAAHNFVHALLRPVDQLSLVDFSSDVREVVPFTNRTSRIDAGLENLRLGPATALYDMIFLSSQSLSPRSGRKVLVIISDGGNTVNGVEYPKALEQAIRSEVMVYSIIDVPIEADAGRDTGGEHAMMTLAQETGGKFYYANANELDRAFEQVSDDLRTQYLIGYYPAHRVPSSDYRRISVRLKEPSTEAPYNVRHRPGYYATPAP
jgi:Ca-activated chloride channel homolog